MNIKILKFFINNLKKISKFSIYDKYNQWKLEKRMAKQRYKRGYSDSDCWSMYYWLTDTFPKMIYTLRDMKHRSS